MTKTITSETLSVMFLDVVGYTSTTSRISREKLNELQDHFDEVAIPTFLKYQGSIIKKIGDAFLITFKSPTNAILCGIELQNSFQKRKKLKIRVAIHTGEVIIRNSDIYGDAVNTAARLESIAKPGHIVFSGSVYLVVNKNEIPTIHLGTKKLKGLRAPIRIFRVKNQYDEILRRRAKRRKAIKKTKKIVSGFLMAIILLTVLATVTGIAIWYVWKFSSLF